MTSELTTVLSQFGPAGLMGLLWILERRHASVRDRQLSEAHRVLAGREDQAAALLSVVRDNTRAIVTLEQTQRYLLRLAERLNERAGVSNVAAGPAAARSRLRREAGVPGAGAA